MRETRLRVKRSRAPVATLTISYGTGAFVETEQVRWNRPFESLRALANWLEQMTAAVGVFAPLTAAGEGRGKGGRPEVLNTPARRPTTWPFESLRALALGG